MQDMEEQRKTTMYDEFDFAAVDVIAVEREARRLRAQAFAAVFRALGRWVVRQVAALRGASTRQTA
jgi:hypothetical protein